jgi:poly(3-hydroxyoctanoate) depolymerase
MNLAMLSISMLFGACVDIPPIGDGEGGAGEGTPVVDWRPDPALGSRCTESEEENGLGVLVLTCPNERIDYVMNDDERPVFYQTPLGAPPAGGWPAVIIFQPSIYWADAHWTGFTMVAGQRHSTEMIQNLLDAGYVVLTPQAQALGDTVWETNVPLTPWLRDWTLSNDHAFLTAIFEDLEDGVYGPVDADALFATGMSSGGYMTSRMALSNPGKFRALAVQSAAWATCLGPLDTVDTPTGFCTVPDTLPVDHPPTLFVHGTIDVTVGIGTMRDYYDAMIEQGYVAEKIEVAWAGHAFLDPSPDAIPAWFDRFLPPHLK